MADVTEVYGARTAAMIEEFDDVCADCGLHFYNPEGEDYCEICGARHNGFALTPQAMEQIGAWSPREE
jgi:rubrerythrin